MSLKSDSETTLLDRVNWVGSATAILFFSSPLYQIVNLYKGKIYTKDIPIFLLLTMLFNTLFWLIYSTCDDIILHSLISNGYGLAVTLVFFFLYLYINVEKNIKLFIFYGLFILDLLFEVYYCVMKYVVENFKDDHPEIIGTIATIIGVLMYASPVQNIYYLIKYKRYQLFPIATNIFGFINSLVWFLSGIMTGSANTLISNGINFFTCLAQIFFWGRYFIYQSREIDFYNFCKTYRKRKKLLKKLRAKQLKECKDGDIMDLLDEDRPNLEVSNIPSNDIEYLQRLYGEQFDDFHYDLTGEYYWDEEEEEEEEKKEEEKKEEE